MVQPQIPSMAELEELASTNPQLAIKGYLEIISDNSCKLQSNNDSKAF